MKDFEGKVAVVTGAASGIGRATATCFAQAGMKVVLADIEEPALAAVVSELTEAGHSVLGVPTDVSKWEAIQALADATMAAFGAVHVVHNNAGVVVSGPLESLSISDWEWVLGVDLWSVIYGVKAFLPLIRQSGEGHIINTASTAGLQATANIGPYNVAKFGVVGLTETLRQELGAGDLRISASVLCPGAVNTRVVESARNRDVASTQDHAPTPEEAEFEAMAGSLLAEHGMDPTAVAEQVLQAIIDNDFWILTHTQWKDVLIERTAAIARDNSLHTGFGG